VHAGAREFRIDETHIERRVVNDQLGAIDEREEFIHDFMETRLVEQELVFDAGDRARAFVDRALGVQVGLVMASRQPTLDHFDTGNFDQTVALAYF